MPSFNPIEKRCNKRHIYLDLHSTVTEKPADGPLLGGARTHLPHATSVVAVKPGACIADLPWAVLPFHRRVTNSDLLAMVHPPAHFKSGSLGTPFRWSVRTV